MRCLPASVLGPVDLPPWNPHTRLPLSAGFLHCSWERLLSAWQRLHRILPPARMMVGCFSNVVIARSPLYLYKTGVLAVKIGLDHPGGSAEYVFQKGALPSPHCHHRHFQHQSKRSDSLRYSVTLSSNPTLVLTFLVHFWVFTLLDQAIFPSILNSVDYR